MELYTDEYFMREALKEAAKALDLDEVPVGAVVVSGKRIIARAHNQVEMLKDATAHAEMLALTAAAHHIGSKYLNDCTLYVSLEPCSMCGGAMFWSQIGRIVFGADDLQRGYHLLKGQVIHPKTEVVKGVLAAESLALLEQFFQRLRKG
ncbi:MAG TPA: nucleoside deaminase [Cyclobacteriaceae bacterium]|nr:nucleoside deaminase [Cyclobacteriaceae bacterium]